MSVSATKGSAQPVNFEPVQQKGPIKTFLITVTQIAVRVLFVLGVVLMTAAAFPPHFHAVALPIATVGSVFLSAFFFSKQPANESLITESPVASDAQTATAANPASPPTSSSVQATDKQAKVAQVAKIAPPPRLDYTASPPVPEYLLDRSLPQGWPVNAPRGLFNQKYNCAFNALVQFIENDVQLANWIRHLIPESETKAEYDKFFKDYGLSDRFIRDFHTFAATKNSLKEALSSIFDLNAFQFPPGDYIKALPFKHLLKIAPAFHRFFAAYDRAIADRKLVVNANTQELRLALHEIGGIDRERRPLIPKEWNKPVDGHEILMLVLGLLPENLRFEKMRQKTKYDTTNHPMRGCPDGERVSPDPMTSMIPVQADGFQKLIESTQHALSYDRKEDNPATFMGEDGAPHDYQPLHTTTEILEAPKKLRILAKRFKQTTHVITTFWNRWFPSIFGAGTNVQTGKITTPLEADGKLGIRLADGTKHIYELDSFIVHQGRSLDDGHYIAYRTVDGRHYEISDSQVIPLDQAAWDQRKNEAYYYSYSHQGPAAQQAAQSV